MKKITSMVIVISMLMMMFSTISFANEEVVDFDAELSVADDLTATGNAEELKLMDAGENIFFDDFASFDSEPMFVSQSGWIAKSGAANTKFGALSTYVEAKDKVGATELVYNNEAFGGNTASVLAFFGDTWMNSTIAENYQCPDRWAAWDYACIIAGFEFYAGTSPDDLKKVAIERAAFSRPGQGQTLAVEIASQLPAETTYFAVKTTNASWPVHLGWVSITEGTTKDWEDAYPDFTYYDYDEDMVLPTITPSPTPVPCATVDPSTIEEDGKGDIIWDDFTKDLNQAYSSKHLKVKQADKTIATKFGSFDYYAEQNGDGNYTTPWEIIYRGMFGHADLEFVVFFHDDFINSVLKNAYPDINDTWEAYEEAIEYAGYKVYAGIAPGSMSEVKLDLEYLKPTEGQPFAVLVHAYDLPSYTEYLKIECNLASGSWETKIANVYVRGAGTKTSEDLTKVPFADNFATIQANESVYMSTQNIGNTFTGALFSDVSNLCFYPEWRKTVVPATNYSAGGGGWVEGSWNSACDAMIGYTGDFNAVENEGMQIVIGAGEGQYKEAFKAVNGEDKEFIWSDFNVLWEYYFKYNLHVYAGPSKDELKEVTINSIQGGTMSGCTYVAINSNPFPANTKYFQVNIDKIFYWPFKIFEVEWNDVKKINPDFTEGSISPTDPQVTPTPEPKPTPDRQDDKDGLTRLFDNFSTLEVAETSFIKADTTGAMYSYVNNLVYRMDRTPLNCTTQGNKAGVLEGSWGNPGDFGIGYTGGFKGRSMKVSMAFGEGAYKEAFYAVRGEAAPLVWNDYEALYKYYIKDNFNFNYGTSHEDIKGDAGIYKYDGESINGWVILNVYSDIIPETSYIEAYFHNQEGKSAFYWQERLISVLIDDIKTVIPEYSTSSVELGKLNGDDVIDINDVVLLVKYVSAKAAGAQLDTKDFPNGTFPSGSDDAAKLTADSNIDINDVVLLVKYVSAKAAGAQLDEKDFPNGTFPGEPK